MFQISVSELELGTRLHGGAPPVSGAIFRRLLPPRSKIIQARWSAVATWMFGAPDRGPGVEPPATDAIVRQER